MKRELAQNSSVSQRLASAVVALNRIHNTAWVAQQCAASKVSGAGTAGVASLLLSERVRAAYQLCRAIQDDLSREDIQFQRG